MYSSCQYRLVGRPTPESWNVRRLTLIDIETYIHSVIFASAEIAVMMIRASCSTIPTNDCHDVSSLATILIQNFSLLFPVWNHSESSIILQSANAAYWNVKNIEIQVHPIKEQRGKSVIKNYLILPELIEWKLMLVWEIFLALVLIHSSHYQWPRAPITRWVKLCPWEISKKQRHKHTRTFSFDSQLNIKLKTPNA